MNYKYTKERFVEDEDGEMVKEVYVPYEDEWMSEDDYKFRKTCIDDTMDAVERDEFEHGCF